MSGFMLMAGSIAVVVGLATYPSRPIAFLFVGAVLLLFVRDLLAQGGAEARRSSRSEKASSDW